MFTFIYYWVINDYGYSFSLIKLVLIVKPKTTWNDFIKFISDFNRNEIGYAKICLIKSIGQKVINMLIEKYKDGIPKNKILGKITNNFFSHISFFLKTPYFELPTAMKPFKKIIN